MIKFFNITPSDLHLLISDAERIVRSNGDRYYYGDDEFDWTIIKYDPETIAAIQSTLPVFKQAALCLSQLDSLMSGRTSHDKFADDVKAILHSNG